MIMRQEREFSGVFFQVLINNQKTEHQQRHISEEMMMMMMMKMTMTFSLFGKIGRSVFDLVLVLLLCSLQLF